MPSALVGAVVQVRAEDGAVVITQEGADGRTDGREIVRHAPVGPGEVALGPFADEARRPTRGVRPRTATELAFLGLGDVAETFLRAAAAAGTLRLENELAQLVALEAAWGRESLLRALQRATTYRRFTATGIRAILAAGAGVPTPRPAGTWGTQLALDLPLVAERPLSAYALAHVAPVAPATAADGTAGALAGGRP